MKFILGMPVTFGLLVLLVVQEAYAASLIWAWYMVPLGLPVLSWQVIAGGFLIRSIVKASVPKNEPVDSRSQDKIVSQWVMFLIWPWFALGLAWVLK